MTTTTNEASRAATRTMWAGLAVTLAVAAFAVIDRSTTLFLADHVASEYPAYSAAEVTAAADFYMALLVAIGVLGAGGWFASLMMLRTRRTAARWLSLVLLAAGLLIAVAGLTVPDTSGNVGLAPVAGWLLLVPCVAGAVAVWQLWRTNPS